MILELAKASTVPTYVCLLMNTETDMHNGVDFLPIFAKYMYTHKQWQSKGMYDPVGMCFRSCRNTEELLKSRLRKTDQI